MPETLAPSALRLADVRVNYGARTVLAECSLVVNPGELVALVGHNGAGKTTLVRAAGGLVPISGGTIHLGDQSLNRLDVSRRARLGLGLVPDAGRGAVFGTLTVGENLKLARDLASGGLEVSEETVQALFPPIYRHLAQPAADLSGGERQMLAIAMSLMREPRLLLLDEPSVGLAPALVADAMSALRRIVDSFGIGVLLVEQNVRAALRVADRVAVLKGGKIFREFAPNEIESVHQLWEYF
ncbi:MAG: ABC transporter ATP-binding protein [Acidimicrobiales bacterium]